MSMVFWRNVLPKEDVDIGELINALEENKIAVKKTLQAADVSVEKANKNSEHAKKALDILQSIDTKNKTE